MDDEREAFYMVEENMASGDLTAGIEALIEAGREKGLVTVDEVMAVLPEGETDVDLIDDIHEALQAAGIAVVEEKDEGSGEEPSLAESAEADHPIPLPIVDIEDSVDLYFSEVGKHPLLTAEEEVALAKRIERGRTARQLLAEGPLSRKRRAELQNLIEDGWAARERLILANSRLVISVAKKYMGRGVPFLDLIQDGNIGLIRATKKFDYSRGHKFSTYATWWIRQAVTRSIADHGRTIRVPVHMGDRINKLQRATHQLTQELGREPTTEELASALDTTTTRIEELIKVARLPLSLERPTDDEEDSFLSDFVEDQEAPAPPEVATNNLLREHLNEVLEALPAREARILQLRHGLVDGKSYTLEEVGQKMGVTRERVRQIEAQALRRLRHPGIRSRLEDYLEP